MMLILLLLLLLRLPKEELRSTSGWDDRRIFIAVGGGKMTMTMVLTFLQ